MNVTNPKDVEALRRSGKRESDGKLHQSASGENAQLRKQVRHARERYTVLDCFTGFSAKHLRQGEPPL